MKVTNEMVAAAQYAHRRMLDKSAWMLAEEMRAVIEAALAAAPQPQGEPVAWVGDPSTQDYASTQPDPVEPVGAAGLFTLAHLWAQQCYFKGLRRPCDIDSARGAFEQALKAYTAPAAIKLEVPE